MRIAWPSEMLTVLSSACSTPTRKSGGEANGIWVEHNIKVSRFDSDLMQSLMELNRDFIRDQQRLGLRITFPSNQEEWRGRVCRLKRNIRQSSGDNVVAITNVAGDWWPQPGPVRVLPEAKNEWEVDIDFGAIGDVKIYIVKANSIGMELITYYRKMVLERNQAILRIALNFGLEAEAVRRVLDPIYWPFTMATLPQGLDTEDCITLNVVSLDH